MNTSIRQTIRYRVCGLDIRSAIAFPELGAALDSKHESLPDVDFEVESDASHWSRGDVVMTWEEPSGGPWLICSRTDDGYRFHFPELADFLADPLGRQVRCVANSNTAPETVRHLFLDQVIPLLLNLRGREALHASAIQIGTGACAFAGRSGRGKSTLAAAFHATGHPVLADDCLLLREDPDQILVEPAYPGLRLWADSRSVFFGNTRSTLPVSHYTTKRRIATPELVTKAVEYLPLRGVYLLRRHENTAAMTEPVIEPLSARDAFMELVEFAFRLDLTDRAMILRQMRVLERVTKQVPVKRLRLPDDLGSLPAARELILQDLERK